MSEIDREILKRLYVLQDIEYQVFQSKLIPTVDPATVIGVRTPALREYAKELSKREDVGVFLAALPHAYFDENQLHAFIISLDKDFGETLAAVDAFLPYVDNWATCDQLSPKVFRKHRAELLPEIKRWMASEHVYTIRFGVGMLMQHYLDEDFGGAAERGILRQYDDCVVFCYRVGKAVRRDTAVSGAAAAGCVDA